MDNIKLIRVRELFDRIARVTAAEEWTEELNPAQRAALAYLARANRFSRAPSNVADYLCTTRGTASQTLKALERKGFIVQRRSAEDKRTISYEATIKGRTALGAANNFEAALSDLKAADTAALMQTLESFGRNLIEQRGFKTFGLCQTCRHHLRTDKGLACALLNVTLTESDANAICFEHDPPPDRSPGMG